MQVLFIDVGQGSCQFILLGDRRAIVIDAGSHPSTTLRALRILRVETIELLIVSHSHIDHSGGAARQSRSGVVGVLAHYTGAINRVAYVFDSDMRKTVFGQYLVKLLKQNKFSKEQLLQIEADTRPQELWSSADGVTKLAAISPLGGDHLLSWESNKPNMASAIVELRHHSDKIVFAADSVFAQWRDIFRLRGEKRTPYKALTLPHHGGQMAGSDEDLEWFCRDAVNAEVVVVSVGTVNPHGHPREAVIRTMAEHGSHVMCTQITTGCCANLESIRPGVIGPIRYPSASRSKRDVTSNARKSRNVACAGTISAMLNDTGIWIERRAAHRKGVDKLMSSGHEPFCRKTSGDLDTKCEELNQGK